VTHAPPLELEVLVLDDVVLDEVVLEEVTVEVDVEELVAPPEELDDEVAAPPPMPEPVEELELTLVLVCDELDPPVELEPPFEPQPPRAPNNRHPVVPATNQVFLIVSSVDPLTTKSPPDPGGGRARRRCADRIRAHALRTRQADESRISSCAKLI
jgi:hypothetical protein